MPAGDLYDYGGGCAMEAMFAFLRMDPPRTYTAEDRDALYRDLDFVACGVQQMNAGQPTRKHRGKKTVDQRELPFVLARIAANAMCLRTSGVLDNLPHDRGGAA